jgi:hypothetical protein
MPALRRQYYRRGYLDNPFHEYVLAAKQPEGVIIDEPVDQAIIIDVKDDIKTEPALVEVNATNGGVDHAPTPKTEESTIDALIVNNSLPVPTNSIDNSVIVSSEIIELPLDGNGNGNGGADDHDSLTGNAQAGSSKDLIVGLIKDERKVESNGDADAMEVDNRLWDIKEILWENVSLDSKVRPSFRSSACGIVPCLNNPTNSMIVCTT